MKSYVRLAGCRRIQVKVRTSPRKNSGPELVQHYTSKTGNISLIYDPLIAINIIAQNPDGKEEMVNIPIDLAHVLSEKLARTYKFAKDKDNKLYILDENKRLTIDNERAKTECSTRMTVYTTYLKLYPGLDHDSDLQDNRAIIFEINDVVAPMPLSIAKALIQNLDNLDVYSYSVLLGIMDQVGELDVTSKKMDKKLDEILRLIQGKGTGETMNVPKVGSWSPAPADTNTFDLFDSDPF